MNLVNSAAVNSMMTVDISQLSIEDAIFVVNMNRMQNAEDRVTIKMTAAQARNVELVNLNSAYASLQNLSSYSLMALVSSVFGPLIFIAIRKYIIYNLSIEDAGFWEGMSRISSYYFLFITSILSIYFLPKNIEII